MISWRSMRLCMLSMIMFYINIPTKVQNLFFWIIHWLLFLSFVWDLGKLNLKKTKTNNLIELVSNKMLINFVLFCYFQKNLNMEISNNQFCCSCSSCCSVKQVQLNCFCFFNLISQNIKQTKQKVTNELFKRMNFELLLDVNVKHYQTKHAYFFKRSFWLKNHEEIGCKKLVSSVRLKFGNFFRI